MGERDGQHLENEQYHLGRDSWFTEGTERPAHGDEGPRRTVHEPARETPVHEETDVLVVGGGPAGCAAAVAAARLGAKVTLAERYGHLGGLSTGGLVIWIDRMSDWEGKQVITGFASEILDRLPEGAVAGAPQEQWGSTDPEQVAHWRERLSAFRDVVTWSPMIDPEWLKHESVLIAQEAGVRLLFHSWVVDVIRDGRELRGAIFESKQGRRAILAKVVVDASGDLDVCAAARVPYESDIEGKGSNVQHCVNTAWTWAGIDFKRWVAFKRGDPEAHRALMQRGNEELGYLETPHAGWRDDVALFLGPRLTGYSGIDVDDLTAVEIESRRRMVAHLDFFRRHAPGFEHAWLMQTAPQTGVRHTRRLIGTHKMTMDEWRTAAQHDDEIGVSPSPSSKFANISVPYGCIVPAELDNVLVGGRHVATDPQTQAFMREIPQCWMTGQAAGVAAAMSAGTATAPKALDIRELQQELRGQGVYLQHAGTPAAA
ncbi:MAG TPA: FAD-dependent oxidoreductase [Solirubrobacteraceae bacterium]|nr:FAD-dependent oxidoreductase [Solirubrobacteraceae bacterium]